MRKTVIIKRTKPEAIFKIKGSLMREMTRNTKEVRKNIFNDVCKK